MDPMTNAYLLTRLAVAQDLSSCMFIFCFGYWMLKLGFKAAAMLVNDDDMFQPLTYHLHRFRHVMTALTLLSFFGVALLPSRDAVAMMLGNKAADSITTAIEVK